MSFDMRRFVIDQARLAGIPDVHLEAVVHRAEMARRARNNAGWRPFRGASSSLLLVSSLDNIEAEIELADRGLARRIVERATQDHARGLLEKRV